MWAVKALTGDHVRIFTKKANIYKALLMVPKAEPKNIRDFDTRVSEGDVIPKDLMFSTLKA